MLVGVAAFLDGWTLVGIPFLVVGVAALLGGVAAFLDGWTLVGGPLLLLGIAAPLGGVALLYRPELPRRLVAWLTKREDCRSRRMTGISSAALVTVTHKRANSANTAVRLDSKCQLGNLI